MKKLIKVLCLVLTMCLFVGICGCAEEEKKNVVVKKNPYDNEDTLMASQAIDITKNKTSQYKIVIAEKANANTKDAADFLSKALALATNTTLEVVTDKSEPYEYEILIGDTNRDECKQVSKDIKENEYRVKMVNKKLCFTAGSYLMLRNSLCDFLFKTVEFSSLFDYKEDKECRVSEDYSLTKVTENYLPQNPIYNKGDFDASALEGLFEGKKVVATEIKDGLGNKFGMHFTDFLRVGNEYWCYYIQPKDDGQSAVGLAISTDGVEFEKKADVLLAADSGWDKRFSSFPGIWYDNGTFYLAYEGAGDASSPGAIGLAVSKDGINFERKGKILEATGKGIYSVNVGTPDLFKKDGKWYLSYHTYDGKSCQLCVAIGTDLMNLTHHKANPVIPTSKNGPDSGTTGRRDVIYYNGWFYMTYEISTKPPYATAKWSHTFARSKDFINWETVEQVIPSKDGFGNDGPSFLVIDGELWVYYRTGVTSRYKLAIE